jgi:hypothetical protein
LYKIERFENGSVMKNIILPIDGIAFALQKLHRDLFHVFLLERR